MTQENIASHRMQITDNLEQLLNIFPDKILKHVNNHPHKDKLVEIVMDFGRLPEARFRSEVVYLGEEIISKEDLQYCIDRIGMFGADNRAGIEKTLHRISAIRNRAGDIIGLTCRIGRAVFGTIVMIRDLVETGKSILLLGRPGVGKTTALREIARVLADDLNKRVVIIDTSNEIAGDGDIPHPAIGRARRMQVARPELQHQVMIEAVENHMPEVIVIDEISTELEALAARTIAERGVQLVGTAHGNQIANLIKNPTLSDLIGGIQAVTLGDDEARRRRSQKTVLERKSPPTFEIAVEMLERQRWVVHEDTAETIDSLLRGIEPANQIRMVNDEGEVSIINEEAQIKTKALGSGSHIPSLSPGGWRASGKMSPVTSLGSKRKHKRDAQFEQMLESSWQTKEAQTDKIRTPGPNGEDWPVYIYPYGIGRSKNRHLPIYAVKSNTIPQITRILRQLLNLDDPNIPEATDLRLFTKAGNDDEIEALEEARLAVEQIVIPQGQPVELLPRSPKVRKMQHELVEHYHLQSDSFGEEPNRRLRIYPA